MYLRSLPDGPPDPEPADRALRLATTLGGAGVIHGDLDADCAAMVGAVLDALAKPVGADDTRSKPERYHDALAEAMKRLLAADLLPDRAGQPVKALVHMTLAELCALDGGSALQREWVTAAAARWAAARAAASVTGSDGGAWLEGRAARALACDAMLVPVVTGDIDPAALDDLVRLCVELHRLDYRDSAPAAGARDRCTGARRVLAGRITRRVPAARRPGPRRAAGGDPPGDHRKGSGPAVRPRRTRVIPAAPAARRPPRRPQRPARHRVQLDHPGRDPHRGHPPRPALPVGRTVRPARLACEVHHLVHLADGGQTSVRGCGLYCTFHHQIMIHRLGWTVTNNPDGTTTARSPDGTKVFRSHSPPDSPG